MEMNAIMQTYASAIDAWMRTPGNVTWRTLQTAELDALSWVESKPCGYFQQVTNLIKARHVLREEMWEHYQGTDRAEKFASLMQVPEIVVFTRALVDFKVAVASGVDKSKQS